MMASLFSPVILQLSGPITDPVQIFLIIIAIMLIAPLVVERLKMPGLIGLIIAGVIVGPYGLNILERDATIELLGTVGLLFLMFLGGLETSLDDLKNNAKQAIAFGLATFALPMLLGTAAMLMLNYDLLAAILVASCFASHTLVALPIVSRLGIMRSRLITVTLGGTMITNVLALLVLAVIVRAAEGELTLGFWLFLIPALTIYTVVTLVGVPMVGRWFFKQFGQDEGAEFIFVLTTLFVVSSVAGMIQVEPIVGAFLAGIAITQLIPTLSPLMNRIQFIGNTLFVPFFLISVGMLVDPLVLIREPQSLLVAGVMITAELISKYSAAWGVGRWFKLSQPGVMVMFGLSLAQAASTLAAITVAFKIDLVDELTVNGTIAMILVSCVLSPWITSRWGNKLQPQITPTANGATVWGRRVLVPVANPSTENNLLQLALILVKRDQGTLLPVHVVSDEGEAIAPQSMTQQRQLLDAAEQIAHAAVVQVETIGRVDNSIDKGIIRAALERQAELIICGWKGYSTYRENFLGGVLDNIVRWAAVPVLVTRFPTPIKNTGRIWLVVDEAETTQDEFTETIQLAQQLADELKATLRVLHLIRGGGQGRYVNLPVVQGVQIESLKGNSVIKVARYLESGDLVLLTASSHRRGEPILGRAPEAIARRCPEVSMVIIHYPRKPIAQTNDEKKIH